MEFLERIKKETRPDKNVLAEVEKTVSKINENLKGAVCVPGGSVAKGTFLKDDFDVDLFVKYDYRYKDKDLSAMLEKTLKIFGNVERVHGSRDYFHIKNRLNYEIVPVLDIKDPKKAMNVTDMSPLHVEWVKKNLKPGQADEIRLAKVFCKANRLYGAESYIRGFSGHVLDILIIHYGSFIALLENSRAWSPKVFIDTESHYKAKDKALKKLNRSKIHGPMIVVDPILPDRNAAAALNNKNFMKFKSLAKNFLQNPSENFFVRKKIERKFLRKLAGKDQLLIVRATPKSDKTDVAGAQIVKSYKYLLRLLKKNDFDVKKSGWEWDKEAMLWFIIDTMPLPEKKIVEGPPAKMREAVNNFKKKYDHTFIKQDRIFAQTKREFRTPEKLIASTQYLNEKLNEFSIENYK